MHLLTVLGCGAAPSGCTSQWHITSIPKLVSAMLLLARTNMVVVEEERLELLFQVARLVLPSNLRCQGVCDM